MLIAGRPVTRWATITSSESRLPKEPPTGSNDTMPISENDRLDLRQAMARVFESDRLADIAMEAMPPLDYDQLATTADLDILGRELRAEMAAMRAEFQGELTGLRGELHLGLAKNLRMMVAAQLTTMVMLGAWITAVT